MTFKSVTQLLDHFKDEATCRAHLEFKRWGGTPACHHCGSLHVYRTNRGFKCAEKECGKKFTVISGSIYENTKLPLRTWFAAIYLITSSKKGISSLQIARQLNVTQKTGWFLDHRIREMLKEKTNHVVTKQATIDETYYGGKAKNKHKSKRKTIEEEIASKAPVIGIIGQDGKVILRAIPFATKRAIAKIIDIHIEKGSTMVSDSHAFYSHLKNSPYYTHEVVNHSIGQYKNDKGFHTNSIENVFSIFKRGLYGIYHSVSHKHLQRYCDEFAARFNTRKIADDERFDISLSNADGRRLKYKDLIKNNAK